MCQVTKFAPSWSSVSGRQFNGNLWPQSGHSCAHMPQFGGCFTFLRAGRSALQAKHSSDCGAGVHFEEAHGKRSEHGAVSATDTAFMSTSRNSSTPIAYLGDGGMPNVLWVLKPSLESEEGYHCIKTCWWLQC